MDGIENETIQTNKKSSNKKIIALAVLIVFFAALLIWKGGFFSSGINGVSGPTKEDKIILNLQSPLANASYKSGDIISLSLLPSTGDIQEVNFTYRPTNGKEEDTKNIGRIKCNDDGCLMEWNTKGVAGNDYWIGAIACKETCKAEYGRSQPVQISIGLIK